MGRRMVKEKGVKGYGDRGMRRRRAPSRPWPRGPRWLRPALQALHIKMKRMSMTNKRPHAVVFR